MLATSVVSVCKPLGLIDDLTRFFLPTNKRQSRVSSSATMNGINSYKPDVPVETVTKQARQKPEPRGQKQLHHGSNKRKRSSPAVNVGKRLRQKSIGVRNTVVRSMSRGKPVSDHRKVTKLKQRRHRQQRDHVESLIDGLTDYFATHGERRLKSPALKSIASYGPESHQAASSHQLDSPTTDATKQLLATGIYSHELSHTKPRKPKATVEKLFDGLSSFFSVHNERRRQPTSPIPSASQDTGVKSETVSTDMVSNETKFSQLTNIPLKPMDRKTMAEKNSQLKGLFDGLSHLYTAHGDRKRKSPFFYTAHPTKSCPPANQQSAVTVKQESVGGGHDVAATAAASQTVKASDAKQQRMPEKLNINKSQVSRKSLKPTTPVAKKQQSSSGTLYFVQCHFVEMWNAHSTVRLTGVHMT